VPSGPGRTGMNDTSSFDPSCSSPNITYDAGNDLS
jgi:hypothetical protein